MNEKYSIFINWGINVYCIDDYPNIHNDENIKFLPQTYAMYWVMTATGINRLFSKDDVYELLVRLAIVLKTIGFTGNWINGKKLFGFTFDEELYDLTIDDVFKHFGMDVVDEIKNMNTREQFFAYMNKAARIEGLIEIMGNSFRLVGDNSDDRLIKDLQTGKAIEVIKEAEKNADFLVRQASENAFKKNERIIEMEQELEERLKRMVSVPRFDILKIPVETRRKCYKIMFDEVFDDEDFVNSKEDVEKELKYECNFYIQHLYLAWLFANGLMIDYGTHAWPEEAFGDLDFDFFEDGGINLLDDYDAYNMKKCEILLKGAGF